MRELHPAYIEQQIIDTLQRLDAATQELHTAYSQQKQAELNLKQAYSEAFINAKGSMDLRRHTATLETSGLESTAAIADAAYKYALTHHKALGEKLSALQSLLRSARLAYQSEGSQWA